MVWRCSKLRVMRSGWLRPPSKAVSTRLADLLIVGSCPLWARSHSQQQLHRGHLFARTNARPRRFVTAGIAVYACAILIVEQKVRDLWFSPQPDRFRPLKGSIPAGRSSSATVPPLSSPALRVCSLSWQEAGHGPDRPHGETSNSPSA